jgi:catechol 2,3-dioxygenase-like lactoylglutathione lyase family enzyme
VHLELVTVVVDDYDRAIAFFAGTLGFDLVADEPALTNDGRPKRWVVVRPPGAATGLLLARADGDAQRAVVGRQAGGRVGFFLRVDDVDVAHAAWRPPASSSPSRPAPSPTGGWPSSSTSPATAGTW